MLEFIGLLAGLLFSFSSIPMTYKTIKIGRVDFVPFLTIISVWGGAILMFTYLVAKNGLDYIVCFDYILTIIGWSIVLFYKIFPRKIK